MIKSRLVKLMEAIQIGLPVGWLADAVFEIPTGRPLYVLVGPKEERLTPRDYWERFEELQRQLPTIKRIISRTGAQIDSESGCQLRVKPL